MLLCRLQSTSLSFTYFIKARYLMKYHCRLNNVYQLLYTTLPYLIIWRKEERKKVNPNILHFFPNLIQLLRSLQIYPFFTTRRSPPSYCASPLLVAIVFGKKNKLLRKHAKWTSITARQQNFLNNVINTIITKQRNDTNTCLCIPKNEFL